MNIGLTYANYTNSMLDQSFSLKNFQEIYDVENRKGNCLEKNFLEFLDLYDKTDKIKRATKLAKRAKTKNRKKNLYEAVKQYKQQKEELLDKHLLQIEKDIHFDRFKVLLKPGPYIKGKNTYMFEDTPINFFVSKQTQINLNKVFKIRRSSRNDIIAQLKCVLSDELPKIIIKTDIKDFYETIQHNKMLPVIDSNPLLSIVSKRYIHKILSQYTSITNKAIGLPRGIGVSACLSEIYMQKLDEKVKSMPNLIYYARYVDDIIMVFGLPSINYDDSIVGKFDEICAKLGLARNEAKTQTIVVQRTTNNKSFDFLGYKITVRWNHIDIDFSIKKLNKIKNRIRKAFCIYARTKNKRSAAHILYQRIKFLTSNTRLINNKNNVVVGIYYSNKFITGNNSLRALDRYISLFYKSISNVNLLTKIKGLSFVNGWEKRIYHKHSVKALKQITKIWHYDENC